MHFYREKYGTLEIKIPPKYHNVPGSALDRLEKLLP